MSDWKDTESAQVVDPDEAERTCEICGTVTKTVQGLRAHKTHKHGKETPPPAPPGTPGRKSSRQQSLQASLSIIGLGLGMIDSYDGAVWIQAVPAQAAALDMAAREYTWAAKACDMLTMAGPVTALASAFLPPVFAILAHHGILPGQANTIGQAMGGQAPPTVQPQWSEEGNVTVNGQTFAAADNTPADLPADLFGASYVDVPGGEQLPLS